MTEAFFCPPLCVAGPLTLISVEISEFPLLGLKITPSSRILMLISIQIRYFCFDWLNRGFHHYDLTPN